MTNRVLTLRYGRKRLRHYFIFGVLWLVFGSVAIVFFNETVFNYGYFVIGMMYFGIFIFENSKQYVTIGNGMLIKNNLISKKMMLEDIIQIKKLAGDYVFMSDTDKIEINMSFLDIESLKELQTFIEELQLNKI